MRESLQKLENEKCEKFWCVIEKFSPFFGGDKENLLNFWWNFLYLFKRQPINLIDSLICYFKLDRIREVFNKDTRKVFNDLQIICRQ